MTSDIGSRDAVSAETRWLSPQEQRIWRDYLEATQRLWERLARALDEDGDLPLHEYEVLVRLSEAPDGALRMSELASALVHSRSRLTHTVGRMEGRGLVERRSCAEDGRGVLCVLTDAGRATLARHAPAHVGSVRENLFDVLGEDDVAALGRIVSTLAENLRPR